MSPAFFGSMRLAGSVDRDASAGLVAAGATRGARGGPLTRRGLPLVGLIVAGTGPHAFTAGAAVEGAVTAGRGAGAVGGGVGAEGSCSGTACCGAACGAPPEPGSSSQPSSMFESSDCGFESPTWPGGDSLQRIPRCKPRLPLFRDSEETGRSGRPRNLDALTGREAHRLEITALPRQESDRRIVDRHRTKSDFDRGREPAFGG
jgi:hypothetical protein